MFTGQALASNTDRLSLQSLKSQPRKTLSFSASVQHVKNANTLVLCEECETWRIVYSIDFGISFCLSYQLNIYKCFKSSMVVASSVLLLSLSSSVALVPSWFSCLLLGSSLLSWISFSLPELLLLSSSLSFLIALLS